MKHQRELESLFVELGRPYAASHVEDDAWIDFVAAEATVAGCASTAINHGVVDQGDLRRKLTDLESEHERARRWPSRHVVAVRACNLLLRN